MELFRKQMRNNSAEFSLDDFSAMTFRNITQPEQSVATYRCPCCGYKTLRGRGQDEICAVCFWHDDGQDEHDADEVRGGPNWNFREIHASSQRLGDHVRDPRPEEL